MRHTARRYAPFEPDGHQSGTPTDVVGAPADGRLGTGSARSGSSQRLGLPSASCTVAKAERTTQRKRHTYIQMNSLSHKDAPAAATAATSVEMSMTSTPSGMPLILRLTRPGAISWRLIDIRELAGKRKGREAATASQPEVEWKGQEAQRQSLTVTPSTSSFIVAGSSRKYCVPLYLNAWPAMP